MLSSIRNRRSSVGRNCVIRFDDGRLRRLRLRPVRLADCVEEGLDVLPLPVEVGRRDLPAVPGVEGGVGRQLLPQPVEMAEPFLVETVAQEGVLVVVDLVADEDRLPVVAEQPHAVVGRLARP